MLFQAARALQPLPPLAFSGSYTNIFPKKGFKSSRLLTKLDRHLLQLVVVFVLVECKLWETAMWVVMAAYY